MDKKLYPLSNPQKSIWLTEEYYKGTNINNIAGTMTINQSVNFDKFILAIKQFVKQNDSCRLQLVKEVNTIKQFVLPYADFPISIIDVNSKEELSNVVNEIVKKPFSLYGSYLFEFTVFRLPNNHGGFIINMHHLIGDSWTLGILVNEIITNYSTLLKNEPLLEKSFSYIDYIVTEKDYIQSKRFEKDKAYWENIFSTVPENATIPATVTNANSNLMAKRKEFNIDNKMIKEITTYCNKYKISIFNFFMAIYAIYLGRVSNLDDFVIGTPILNRTNFQDKNTTGMFINTLPLRVQIDENSSFEDFVNFIANQSMGLLRHQKYYYQYIIEDLRKKDSSLPSLYNIMISYQITKMTEESDTVPHESNWYFTKSIADDLDIHLLDLNDTGSLNIAYDYRICKYHENDIYLLHQRIIYLINQILSTNTILIKNLEIVTPEEKTHLLFDFNPPKVSYPSTKTVMELFEEQVQKTPNNTAVVFEGQTLSYLQLSQKVNELAHYLNAKRYWLSRCSLLIF